MTLLQADRRLDLEKTDNYGDPVTSGIIAVTSRRLDQLQLNVLIETPTTKGKISHTGVRICDFSKSGNIITFQVCFFNSTDTIPSPSIPGWCTIRIMVLAHDCTQ